MAENNDELLAQFQDITGADVERSNFFLESSNWNLEVALGSFFEAGNASEADLPSGAEPVPEQEQAAEAVQNPSPVRRDIGNIRTLESSDDDNSDSDMEEGQAFYAGGSETSGQQILGPPKKKDGRDFVKEMFKKAKEHGAESVDPATGARGASSSRNFFVGAGFRLGSTEGPSQVIGQASAASAAPAKPREYTLKMWRNGFSIDDGELRLYDDPQNREFLMSVMSGRIPKELIAEAKGGEVHVNMEDHKEEEYKKPKAAAKPFQGTGFVLGNIVPSVVGETSTSAVPAASADQVKDLEESAQREIGVVADAPCTTIQIRMPDGRLQAKLNVSHTIGDLRRYITLARPHLSGISFALLTTFPNKELTDDSQTLKDAGLVNAAILLRMK